MFKCQILADSISSQGYRLTTFQVTFPRFILAEVNTHRMLSRNSASSRAVPIEKSIKQVSENPFVPASFGSRNKGMSAGEPIAQQDQAYWTWKSAADHAVMRARVFEKLDVHKSQANRILEPYKWHTAIISGTDWGNFFALRCSPEAQPEFRTIAEMMQEAYSNSEPRELSSGQWHVPKVSDDEIDTEAFSYPDPWVDWEMWCKVSVGRVARVSFERQDERDRESDIVRHDRLLTNRHLSPFEHVARPFTDTEWQVVDSGQSALRLLYGEQLPDFVERLCRQLEYNGNYQGWIQRRAGIPNEHDASLAA